jgi:hypothetical protein
VALDCALILAESVGDWTEAARLYGASEAHREAISCHRESSAEVIVRRSISPAKRALGETSFRACVTSGRCLSYQGALSEAAAWLTTRRWIPNQGTTTDWSLSVSVLIRNRMYEASTYCTDGIGEGIVPVRANAGSCGRVRIR